jgi:Flp pilus assembly protein TadD
MTFERGERRMIATRTRKALLPMAFAGAATAALMSGGTVATAKPSIDTTASQAQSALDKGKVDKAISLAEEVVAASPREASYRTLLANAYLRAGRFESATTAFNDAMELGDNSARTALALALANSATGRNQKAVAILDDWRDAIPAGDLGLALALAGETRRGVSILSDAVRGGDSTVKLRQNLAYAYALDGRWREARMMISQDLPANQIDARIGEWAMRAQPENFHQRIAGLLSVPMRNDTGQPQELALSASPAAQQLAVETATIEAQPTAVAANAELPAVDGAEAALASYAPPPAAVAVPTAPQQSFETAFVAAPTIQQTPASAAQAKPVKVAQTRVTYRAAPAKAAKPRAVTASGSHLVQLGSFASAQGARRAWGIFASRNPNLRSYRMTITPAVVHGKNFWRVAAAGFNARSASGMCSSVKARGGVCFAYSALPARVAVPGKPALARSYNGMKLGNAGTKLARR